MRRFRLPPDDAEDVLQDTFLAFLHKREEIRDPEAWIVGTVRNRCLMYWRGRRRRLLRVVDDSLIETFAEPGPPSQERCDLRRDLDRAMESIPPRCRTLLQLRYGQDRAPKEAAEFMGYRSSGIHKILERCLDALARGLVVSGFLGETES